MIRPLWLSPSPFYIYRCNTLLHPSFSPTFSAMKMHDHKSNKSFQANKTYFLYEPSATFDYSLIFPALLK